MKEIKFLKELPSRFVNKNTAVFSLRGADMYVDAMGNRYAYIAFTNESKLPFYSLYLYIKEYDSTGTLLKEEKYVNQATYGDESLYITKEPIPMDKECDAIDIYIAYVEFNKKIFYKDALSSYRSLKLEEIFDVAPETNGDFMTFRKDQVKNNFLSNNVTPKKANNVVNPNNAMPTIETTTKVNETNTENIGEDEQENNEVIKAKKPSILQITRHAKKKPSLYFIPVLIAIVLAALFIVLTDILGANIINNALNSITIIKNFIK